MLMFDNIAEDPDRLVVYKFDVVKFVVERDTDDMFVVMRLFVFILLFTLMDEVEILDANKDIVETFVVIKLELVIDEETILFDVRFVVLSCVVKMLDVVMLEEIIFVVRRFVIVDDVKLLSVLVIVPKLVDPLMTMFPTVKSPARVIFSETIKDFPIKRFPEIEPPPNVVKLPPEPIPIEFVVFNIEIGHAI